MADATKSLWSRLLEGGSEKLSNSETAKRACPYDRKSCPKAQDGIGEGFPKNSGQNCHLGCPEPKRPLQPEEFCPDLVKPKLPPPPPCCFIRMQDPCAPCCCPPPNKCEDECRPGPKRDPICGCDLCKKRLCPDGKCCGATEPSCQKDLRKCNSESQTSFACTTTLETTVSEVYEYPERKCDPPVCQCKEDYLALLKFIKRPLDWLLCTPLKIPIPRIEWRYIQDPKPEEGRCNSTHSGYTFEKKCCPPSTLPDGHASRSPRCCDADKPIKPKNVTAERSDGDATCNENTPDYRYFQDNPSCECGPCRVRRLFERSYAEGTDPINKDKRLDKTDSDACGCRLCQVRRTLRKPAC